MPKLVHVYQKRIVALDGRQLNEMHFATPRVEPGGQFALLAERKEDVGLHEDALGAHFGKARRY